MQPVKTRPFQQLALILCATAYIVSKKARGEKSPGKKSQKKAVKIELKKVGHV